MNINFDDLERLIRLAERSNIRSLEVNSSDTQISIVCQPNDNESSQQDWHTAHHKNSEKNENEGKGSNSKLLSVNSTNTERQVDDNNDQTIDNQATPTQVLAPMLGTFYLRSSPTADVFVKVGESVDKGQTLCIVEAMKMMHEVKAEAACTIKDILVSEGDIVEYAQALFTIDCHHQSLSMLSE